MIKSPAAKKTDSVPVVIEEEVYTEPEYGTVGWLYTCSQLDGHLPTPIDVSITDSIKYNCPELKWYNFDVYPHKIKLTNTGYTALLGAKWRAERPYLEGGPFLEKHIFSQIHFHWGADMTEGSDHTVDKRRYPAEMQVTFFRAEYMTQEEAFKHPDGVVMVCYLIKYSVDEDERLSRIIEGFPRVRVAQTSTRIGPYPMSYLLPMFYEDYFFYWGSLDTCKGDKYVVRWLIPRVALFVTFDQMKEFRKLGNPWDEPLERNFRPLQPRGDRNIFFISPHWNQYNSLLPIPVTPEESISVLSPAYQNNPNLLPALNAYMLPSSDVPEPQEEVDTGSAG